MSTLPRNLHQLSTELENVQSVLVKMFNQGIPETEVDAAILRTKLELPTEVYELYAWKNGLNESLMQ